MQNKGKRKKDKSKRIRERNVTGREKKDMEE